MQRRILLLITCLSLWLLPSFSSSTSFVMMSDQVLLSQSDAVVAGTVTTVSSKTDGVLPLTLYSVSVSEWVKGGPGEETVIVQVPGGQAVNGKSLRIAGAPRFEPGSKVLLFLDQKRTGYYSLQQFLLGAFHRWIDSSGREWAFRLLGDAIQVQPGTDQVAPGRDNLRDFNRFRSWLRQRLLGYQNEADYVPEPTEELQALETVLSEAKLMEASDGIPLRWFDFDSDTPVEWLALNSGQSGMTSGGFPEFETALNLYSENPSTKILYQYAGTTSSTSGINTILWDDPNNEIGGSFSCSSGGTLAVGGPSFYSSTLQFNGESYHPIVQATIITQDGAGCFFGGNDGKDGEEVFAH